MLYYFSMARKLRFGVEERYHCYSRGVDKRVVFVDEYDRKRFGALLYLLNNNISFRHREYEFTNEVFSSPRSVQLVAIEAYALMPNHYHLILREIIEGGISTFMQKLGTAYTMYFNAKYERAGNLFVKPFRAKHIIDDRYFQHLVRYIHLNPAELFEHSYKQGRVLDLHALERDLLEYPHSSLPDYLGIDRPERAIINPEVFAVVQPISLQELIQNATEYYTEFTQE